MPSRRIAFVHFHTFRMLRGIEILVLSLADELVKQDYDVSILTARRMMEPRVIPDPRLRIPEVTLPRCYEEWSIAAQYAWGLVRNKYDTVTVFFADFGEANAWRLAHQRGPAGRVSPEPSGSKHAIICLSQPGG